MIHGGQVIDWGPGVYIIAMMITHDTTKFKQPESVVQKVSLMLGAHIMTNLLYGHQQIHWSTP